MATYTQFGNYIGPDLGGDDSDDELGDGVATGGAGDWDGDDVGDSGDAGDEAGDAEAQGDGEGDDGMMGLGPSSHALVLHEDKQYYPNASDVYPDAEILIEEEDTQPLETPIVAPIKTKTYEEVEKELPATTFSYECVLVM